MVPWQQNAGMGGMSRTVGLGLALVAIVLGVSCNSRRPTTWIREDVLPATVFASLTKRGVLLPVRPVPLVDLAPGDVLAFSDAKGDTRMVLVMKVSYCTAKKKRVSEDRRELWEYVNLHGHDYWQGLLVRPANKAYSSEEEAVKALSSGHPVFSSGSVYEIDSRNYPRDACKVIWPQGRDAVVRTRFKAEWRIWPPIPAGSTGRATENGDESGD